MRSIQLFVVPLAVAIFVSASFAQDTDTKADKKDFAKAAKMLHGVWSGDAEKTAEAIKEMDDLEMDEAMVGMILERVGLIEVDFQDGTFNVMIDEQEMSGDWKVTAVEKDDKSPALKIHVMPAEDSEGEEKNFKIHFLGKTHIKMIDLDDGGPPIVLARKVDKDKDE